MQNMTVATGEQLACWFARINWFLVLLMQEGGMYKVLCYYDRNIFRYGNSRDAIVPVKIHEIRRAMYSKVKNNQLSTSQMNSYSWCFPPDGLKPLT